MITLDRSSVPFKYAVTADAIDSGLASELRSAIAAFDDWEPASAHFYRNSLRHFTESDVPAQLEHLVTPELTGHVREAVESAFEVTLAPNAQMMLNRFETCWADTHRRLSRDVPTATADAGGTPTTVHLSLREGLASGSNMDALD